MLKKVKKFWKKRNEEYFIYLAIFMVVLIFFSIIWPVTYVVLDQVRDYIFLKTGNYWKFMYDYAINQGRYNFLIIQFVYLIPYLFDSVLFYKLFSYFCILFDVSALFLITRKYINKNIAYLTVLLFFGFAQIDTQHNLFVAYTGIHQLAIGFALFSVYFFLRYYDEENRKNKYLVLSAVFLVISIIIYESFLTFPLLFLLLYIIKEKQIKIKEMLKTFRYHIGIVGLHLIIFFIWKMKFPSTYDGSSIEISNLWDSVRTIIIFAFGLFPTLTSFRTVRHINMIPYIDTLSFMKAFFLSAAVMILVMKVEKDGEENKRKNGIILILAGISVFLPTFLHGFTPKYVGWMKNGTTGYVPSFYSYFFICILLSMFFSMLYRHIKFKKVILFFTFVLTFLASILTDVGNKVHTEKFYEQRLQGEAFRYVISRDFFKEIPEAVIYVPDFIKVFGDTERMSVLAEKYTGKKHKFQNQWKGIDFQTPVYILKYEKETNTMMLAQIDQNYQTDKIIISSPTPVQCSLIANSVQKTSDYKMNGVDWGTFPKTAILPIELLKNQEMIVEGTSLNVLKTQITSGHLKENGRIQYEFQEGFYENESWGNWCDSKGIIWMTNNTSEPIKIHFSANYKAGEEANLWIKGCNKEENFKIGQDPQKKKIELLLEPGVNQIEISSDAKPIVTNNGDTRRLVFGISEIGISERLKENGGIPYEFQEGFYENESWGNWCDSKGIIWMTNNTSEPIKIHFSANYKAGEEANLWIKGCNKEENFKIGQDPQKKKIELLLEPGVNQIEISSDAKPIVTNNGDTRRLVFGISEIEISVIPPIEEKKNEEN